MYVTPVIKCYTKRKKIVSQNIILTKGIPVTLLTLFDMGWG